MSDAPPAWFERSFATPRLRPYKTAAKTSGTHAEDLYRWNLQVSEAFYPALSCLEISTRNSMHEQLRVRYSRADWWSRAPLHEQAAQKVTQVSADLRGRKGSSSLRADDIVAELSFGFWVSLLSRRYDRHFWVPALHKSFPGYHGDRESLRDNLQAILLLRNRIMHHEPIHHRHLAADHEKIYRLLGYVEPQAAAWLRNFDRVSEVLNMRPRT
jgi:hypothetical protein